MRLHWGTGLLAVFGLFVLGVLMMVGIALTRKVDLVTDGYYEKGLRYEEQMEKIRRARRRPDMFAISVRPEGILVQLHGLRSPREVSGQVRLYRPSDGTRDFSVPIGLDSLGLLLIPRGRLEEGVWRVALAWDVEGREYYTEERVEIR